jgi:hypothetical protein
MLLYAEHITSRLHYILQFVSKEFFQDPILVTSDKQAFKDYRHPKINYSNRRLSANEFWICPSGLLREQGIREQQIECFAFGSHTAFFATPAGEFPFDIFSAAFYLISRYEEYLPHEKDSLGRFNHTASLAYRKEFLRFPLVNYWLKLLKAALQQKFPDLYFIYTAFKFIPTYDIDQPYAYADRGWRNNLFVTFKDAMKGNWNEVKARAEVLNGKRKDPYDAYEWLDALHLYCRLKPHYFFLLANEQNHSGAEILSFYPALKQLIEYYAASYKIGIQPSSQNQDDKKLVKEQIDLLEVVSEKEIIHSRIHQLRMFLPESYRELIRLGIRKDHSMGYTGINGFRASVASSFNWYDLEKEEETDLVIFPFCFSDTTAFYEEKLSAQQAFQQLMTFYNAVRNLNGLMITIWHNQFLGSDERFKGWKDVYEIFLKDEVYWD